MKKLLLAIPILIDEKQRLTECLAGAFEQTLVKNGEADIYVILNNENDESIIDQIDKFDDGYLIVNDTNFGVSGSWNQAILEARKGDYKYTCCVGFDTIFKDPQLLEDSVAQMDKEKADFGRGRALSFNFWMVNSKMFPAKVGFFDENYYPAYWEDLDMMRRLRMLRELGIVTTTLLWDSDKIEHSQSGTVNDHPQIPHDVWNYTYTQNQMYMAKKWGTYEDDVNKGFRTPFNDNRLHTSFWFIDSARLEKHREKWDACINK